MSPSPETKTAVPTDPSTSASTTSPPAPSFASIKKWALYGQRVYSDPSEPIQPRTSPPYSVLQMSKPILTSWTIPLSGSQILSLRQGFKPRQMEDKWLIYSIDEGEVNEGVGVEEEKDQEREEMKRRREEASLPERMRVFLVRSWTRRPVYELGVRIGGDGKEGGKDDEGGEGEKDREEEQEGVMEGRIESLTWESDKSVVGGHDEEGKVAKERAREVCRWILGMELDNETGIDVETGEEK